MKYWPERGKLHLLSAEAPGNPCLGFTMLPGQDLQGEVETAVLSNKCPDLELHFQPVVALVPLVSLQLTPTPTQVISEKRVSGLQKFRL